MKTAYLNAKIVENNFRKQPEGLEKIDEEGKPLVCLLRKSLYDLKQSGRNWHRTLKSYLEELALTVQFLVRACLSDEDEDIFMKQPEGFENLMKKKNH